MGKKSRRNKKNNGGPVRKELGAAVPTAAAREAATIYDTVYRLLDAYKYDEILEVESKYGHLNAFSDDPFEDAYILYAFGSANCYAASSKDSKDESAIEYYERAKERMKDSKAGDRREAKKSLKAQIETPLALLYSEGRDMEKGISSHRWLLVNCNRHEVTSTDYYLIRLSSNFNRFEKFEYTIEVLEGAMDLMETVEEEVMAETLLIAAYYRCGEFLKAKAANEKRRSNDWTSGMQQSGRIEEGLCNYEAAISQFRKEVAGLQKQEYDDSLMHSGARFACSMGLARTLLRHDSVDNEDEAFAIFQEELDRCVDPINRVEVLFQMGEEYRKLNKWDQSIEALRQLCLSSTRPDGTMLPLVHEAMAHTYLEQYCTDTTLDIDQRTEILCQAQRYSYRVHIVSTKMHLIFAQLFYFNGDKQQAYYHLELYLDAHLAKCKLSCYTCKQRVRHGSVPFSCASCRVASYCGRTHQKLTWKNERICHKVFCPLLGYWRIAKEKQNKHKGLTDEDQFEYERVFKAFFESICSHYVKTCIPL